MSGGGKQISTSVKLNKCDLLHRSCCLHCAVSVFELNLLTSTPLWKQLRLMTLVVESGVFKAPSGVRMFLVLWRSNKEQPSDEQIFESAPDAGSLRHVS